MTKFLTKYLFFSSSRFCSICNTCGHCVLDINLCGGTSPWTDKYSCVHNNLLCDRSVFSLLCKGLGHHHQRTVGWKACAAASPGLDSAAEPRHLCEHTDQLPKPGPGHIQHFPCNTNILRFLYNLSFNLFSYSF